MLLTMEQVANAWVDAGGPSNRAVEWVAIAMGESGLNTTALSPVGAEGLWQIMPFHWGPLGLDGSLWADPLTNAKAAVAISGHGTNCAAWDSAYRNIYASGRYSFLAWPEPGSADYEHMQTVAAAIGGDKFGGAVPNGGQFPSAGMNNAIGHMQQLATKLYPGLDKFLVAQRMGVNALYRPGG